MGLKRVISPPWSVDWRCSGRDVGLDACLFHSHIIWNGSADSSCLLSLIVTSLSGKMLLSTFWLHLFHVIFQLRFLLKEALLYRAISADSASLSLLSLLPRSHHVGVSITPPPPAARARRSRFGASIYCRLALSHPIRKFQPRPPLSLRCLYIFTLHILV